MNSYQQQKTDIIAKVCLGKMTIRDAVVILNKSHRTIERYIKKYKERGVVSVIHGNANKRPSNKFPTDKKNKILGLMKEKYYDFNLTHALEFLREQEHIDIKYSTFRRICQNQFFLTKVKSNRREKKNKPRTLRDRTSQPGILLQMDGSYHKWFNGKEYCLITLIDDANSEIIFAKFSPSESTFSCMEAVREVIEQRGLFSAIYTDHAGVYGGNKRQYFCQFKRAVEELGINVIFANSPQAKGRIERSYRTLQDRLIPEMRLKGINNVEDANKFIQEYFIPFVWNKKFTIRPIIECSGFRSLFSQANLKEIFCVKEYRQIKNDHTFSFGTNLLQIMNPGEYSLSGEEIEVRIYPNEEIKFYFQNKLLIVEKVESRIKQAA